MWMMDLRMMICIDAWYLFLEYVCYVILYRIIILYS